MTACAESPGNLPSQAELDDREGARSEAEPGPFTFRELYERHFDGIYGLIARYGVAPGEVEDLTQRVFLVVHRRTEELREVKAPSAWLRAIAVRVVHEHYRWRRIRRIHSWVVEHSWAAREFELRTPENHTLAEESLNQVRQVLQRMSAKLRDTLVLVDLEELSPREAADILGIPTNTVRSRRSLARAEFRRLWQETTGESPESHD